MPQSRGRFFWSLGLITFIVIILVLVIALVAWLAGPGVPGKTILEVNLEQGMIEYVPQDPLAETMAGGLVRVRDVVEAIERAAGDERVVALYARIGAADMGLAKIQEIRDAVAAFRAGGKPAFAFAETFGEFAGGNGSYYLATAFDEIYLQPSGDIGLTGLIMESPFLRGTLQKLGIEPRMDHRYEYKNAKNMMTETAFTEAHREAMTKVMNAHYGQVVRGIAAGRGLSEEQVREVIARGPYLGEEALRADLVDEMLYRDEVMGKIKTRVGADAELLYLDKYLERAGRPHESGPVIALIYGVGGVERGASGYDPLFGDVTMGADTVAAAFRAAIEDEEVRAILFRVDSPGGSYVASDTIWRETQRARAAGKPVIISMGDVAGSGGYFVAMGADKVVAQPGTITGSIGVLGGKMLTRAFWQEKIGITWDDVTTSENATIWTGTHDYTEQGWARFQAWLDRVYTDFTGKVAEGRNMHLERVREIAKGRIWSGEDARELGLVDELGGFPVALRLCKQAAGIGLEESIQLRLFPEEKGFFQLLMEEGPPSSDPATAAVLQRTLRAVQPATRLAAELGLLADRGVLTMPVVRANGRR
ncbi:MAG: signal peptide peptidase SppA [Acidobacteria bacterium]|nr:signal peptide peptidase SppA [Acidobacteriota bacterium]